MCFVVNVERCDMKITEKQLICLFDILKDSVSSGIELSGQFALSRIYRHKLYEDIMNQQSNVLREVTTDEL